MAKQFCYQDQWGVIYPEHPALRFEPSLVPGHYDTEKKVFMPVGNPQAQVGNIITDGDTGKVLSGLKEDKGANTAPVNGVIISQPDKVEPEEEEQEEQEQAVSGDVDSTVQQPEENPVGMPMTQENGEVIQMENKPKKRIVRKVQE